MKTALKEHINTNLSFLNSKKILIAVSGGIDSVVLTHLMHKLKFNIALAHCNFMLRGKESNKDELFVKTLGEKLGIPVFSTQFETEKYAQESGLSIQMAARELRYHWFAEIAQKNNYNYILTAHQKEDVIETFLINLTRGTGLDGLTGIPTINENIVRPLLPFSRKEILVYANKKKLEWREDQSNASIKYFRNKIRHKVVPILKELNPNLLQTFQTTIEHLKGSRQIIEDTMTKLQKEIITIKGADMFIDCTALDRLNNPKIYLYELLKDYGFTEWSDMVDLLYAQTGKQLFSKTHRLLKNRDKLILSKINNSEIQSSYQISEKTSEIKIPIHLKLEVTTISSDGKSDQSKLLPNLLTNSTNTATIDYEQLNFPLVIRKWQLGDYFYPIGLNGKKKVSKFFKDEKISRLDKEKTWVLCSNSEIVWVVGHRIDDRFKVKKTTSKILKITL